MASSDEDEGYRSQESVDDDDLGGDLNQSDSEGEYDGFNMEQEEEMAP